MEIIVSARLHAPLFCGGKNHKDMLYSKEGVSMVLQDDFLYVKYNGEICKLHVVGSVFSMVPLNQEAYEHLFEQTVKAKMPLPKKTHVSHATKLDIRGAQVSDPSTMVQNPPHNLK